MIIHKEGFSFLICSLIFVLISFFISIFLFSILINLFISFFLITLYSFFLFFFRNPKRNFSYNENEVISPADGKILEIKSVFENEYLKKDCICISIFMSPFNVHVNRFPVSGIITYVRYHPGKYWFAWNKKASFQNERTTTVVETKEKQKILFRQIAGFLARRIIIYAKKNFLAKKGEEFGFIKFGSRVDIYLPLKSIIIIKKGEKVIGGKTIISIIQ